MTGNAREVKVGSDGTVLAAVDNNAYLAAGGDLTTIVNLSTGSDTTLPGPGGVGGIEFAIAPSDPNIMYATYITDQSVLMNVYMSADKGMTWSVVFPANSSFDPFLGGGCYASSLAVFPNDPYQLLLGGIDVWRGKKYQEGGYYNWEEVSYPSEAFIGNNQVYPQFIPIFQHDIVFRPNDPNQFALASDEGVTIGTLSGDSALFQFTNKNLVNTQFNNIAFSRQQQYALGGAYFIGTQIIGPYSYNDPMNSTQIAVGTTIGYYGNCEWSVIDPNAIIFSSYDAALASTVYAPFSRSGDLGTTISPTFLGGTNPSYTNGIKSAIIPYIPISLWESFHFENSNDSVTYIAHRRDSITGKIIEFSVPADSTIIVNSANGRFPFEYTTTAPISKGDSVRVKISYNQGFSFMVQLTQKMHTAEFS